MLQLHGQRLQGERKRQRRLSEPHLFYSIGEQFKQAPLVRSGRRRESDRTNGITANISGKKYFFTTRLLARYPESLLASKHKRKYFYDCIRDEYFFDRNRIAFESIFTFYESKGTLVLPNAENFPEQLFADELYFFGLYEYLSEHDKTSNVVIPRVLKKKPVAPTRGCQKEVWKIFELPDSSVLARLINLFSSLVIIASAVIMFVDTLPGAGKSESLILISKIKSPILVKNSTNENISHKSAQEQLRITSAMEVFCIGWFTLELLIRFLVSPEKKNFFVRPLNVIDLIAIIPFYVSLIVSTGRFGPPLYIMRVLRLCRVFRVMKISHYVSIMNVLGETIKASAKDLWTLCFLILIGTVFFGSLAYYLEQWDVGTPFDNIPISCWWALVTITTLGYGDLAPKTLGKQHVLLIPGTPCLL